MYTIKYRWLCQGESFFFAWSGAFMNACFSASLTCMIFLLTAAKKMQALGRRKLLWSENSVCGKKLVLFYPILNIAEVDAYPQRSSGHSLFRAAHGDTGRSCSRWSFRCIGICGSKSSAVRILGSDLNLCLEPHSASAAPVTEGQQWLLCKTSRGTDCLKNWASVRVAHRIITKYTHFSHTKSKNLDKSAWLKKKVHLQFLYSLPLNFINRPERHHAL